MCTRLVAAVDRLREFKTASDRKLASINLSADVLTPSQAVQPKTLQRVVAGVEAINLKINNPEDCGPMVEGEAFPRNDPRPGKTNFQTSRRGPEEAWSNILYNVKG